MTAPTYQADLERVVDLLESWVARSTDEEGHAWLRSSIEDLRGGSSERKLFTSFSGAPRYVGKSDLDLTPEDLTRADELRSGWSPYDWSTDQAARAAILLSFPHDDVEAYFDALEKLFSTADVRELIVLYECLPLLPHPERLRGRAAEGLRSNVTSVFNAVAHRNPYPAEYFDDGAWNQMVLKALFVGSPLYPIQGLDDRTNPTLARMLVDYAKERWAAERPVSPELWRPVGPLVSDGYVDELALVLGSNNEVEREAAALALSKAESEKASALLDQHPELKERIAAGDLTWESFSRNRIPR